MKYLIFRAGNYPQGTVTVDDVMMIADNYDRNYHEAPLTINHYDDPIYGIVEKLEANDKGELWAEFGELDQWIIDQVNKGKYRKPSIEIADYTDKGKYLRAVTLTNFPQVKNLPRIMFSDSDGKEKEVMIVSDPRISVNLKNNKMDLKKYSEKIKSTFSEVPATAEELIDKLFALIEEFKTKQEVIDEEMNELKTKVQLYEQARIDELITKAKAKLKDITAFESLAKNNYDEAVKLLDSIPESKMFEKDRTRINAPEKKNVTYGEILSDPDLARKFNDEEIIKMRNEFLNLK